MKRPLLLLAPFAFSALASSCGPKAGPACPPTGPAASLGTSAAATTGPAPGASGSASPPSVDDAKAYVTKLDGELRRVQVAQARADWVYQTDINDDSEALDTAATTATGEFLTRAALDAARFDPIKDQLPKDVARQLHLLKIAQDVPSPTDRAHREELAGIQSAMQGIYGKGKVCLPRWNGQCQKLDAITNLRAHGKTYDELYDEWAGWHETSKPMREKYQRYVELANEGAREIGFADTGALWRERYDMPADAFSAEVDRLWGQVKPLYDQLHCYVRGALQKTYGKDKVPDHQPIPAHLLGNMWAQEWSDDLDLVTPYAGEPSLDASKGLVSKKYDAKKMVELGEAFFTSLGFDKLPASFWERSQLVRPQDREVICHASAWDVGFDDDLRVKVCLQPTEEDLITIHHELGHDYYFHSYYTLPMLFQQGANDGFHEGIGDTIALSITPEYLKSLGLIDGVPKGDHGRINQLMKRALEKVAFLPFGLLIDKWRWDVFSGKTPASSYNAAWWALRTQYQGIAPAQPRGEEYFDPGAKYHVAASVPYIRYFLSFIYQFQFHRALCKAAGYTGPLDQCSIHGNKAAGEKLEAMLSLGASKTWQEALGALSGETSADASAILDYFAPLQAWLETENKGRQCGW